MNQVEIKIRPVTRYLVTRFSSAPTSNGHVDEIGEFQSHAQASHVAHGIEALALSDGKPASIITRDDRMSELSDIDLLAEIVRRQGRRKTESPHTRRYHTAHYDICLAVGNDHTADLTLDADSLGELNRRTGALG